MNPLIQLSNNRLTISSKFLPILFLFFFSSNLLAQGYIYPNKWYFIESALSKLHLDVRGGSKQAKADIWMYRQNNTAAQKWKLVEAGGGFYYIQSQVSGLVLDVRGGSKAAKTQIWQYTKNGTDAQKWEVYFCEP